MNVCNVTGRVARCGDDAELLLDGFAVGYKMIRCHCVRRSFLQQSAQQYQSTFLGDVLAEPGTNSV